MVGEQTLQCRLLQLLIRLLAHVGSGPVNGPVNLFEGACGHLNQTVARFATQGLDVIFLEREAFHVRKLRRIAKGPER
jgi:hypothetical protein